MERRLLPSPSRPARPRGILRRCPKGSCRCVSAIRSTRRARSWSSTSIRAGRRAASSRSSSRGSRPTTKSGGSSRWSRPCPRPVSSRDRVRGRAGARSGGRISQMADQQTTSGQGGGAGSAPPASGESQPVQLYRFKVKTADGREVTSAIAVVDPNAGDEHDAAGEKEDLEKKHQEELKKHEEEIAKLHEDEKQRHAADISQSHGSEAERHEQHLDDVQQHEIAKHEQQLDQAHREELDQHEGQLDEKHDKSVATLVSDAADKASQLITDHAAELDALHLGGLRKFAEEHLVQLHDALGKAHGEQDQKHQEETAKLHDELLGKHGEELTK